MAASDSIGDVNDEVRLELNAETVLIAESYEVKQSFFEQPATFSITLGSGTVAHSLLTKYYARIPFKLSIGNVAQFVGTTDAIEASSTAGATSITIRGRDRMAELLENRVRADTAFSEASYSALVDKVLLATVGPEFAIRSNDAQPNRKAKAGVNVTQFEVPAYLAELFTDLPQKPQIQAKAGENFYHYLKRELDRAGLFLYCGADGTFILNAPNVHQDPIYQIIRQRGALRNVVNCEDAHFKFDTTGRSATYVVLGRGGGAPVATGVNVLPDELIDLNLAVGARAGISGTFQDVEMQGLGFTRAWVKKDKHATNSKQANYFARKMGAQQARHGFDLGYKVSGHTVPALAGGRAVWSVDTMVQVQDDEYGIDGPFWIESVARRRAMGGGTTTDLKLVRPQDLVFGGSEE